MVDLVGNAAADALAGRGAAFATVPNNDASNLLHWLAKLQKVKKRLLANLRVTVGTISKGSRRSCSCQTSGGKGANVVVRIEE